VDYQDWNPEHGRFERITVGSDERNLPAAERARLQSLQGDLDALQESLEGEGGEWTLDLEERAETLEAEIEALRERARAFTPDQRAAAGAIVTIAANGTLEVHRGLVRKGSAKADTTRGGASERLGDAGNTAPAKKPAKPDLSASLMQRLQAQRTAIVQLAMLDAPHAAMAVLVNALLATVAPGGAMRGPCRIRHEGPGDLRQAADELPLMRHFITLQERKSALLDTLPKPSERFDWLLAQSPETLDELLTLAVALSIDTSEAAHGGSRAEKAAMESLVAALGIDFAAHWSATKETFLGHVPRAVIEQAVREARDAKEVEKLAGKKKAELVDAAEHLLADTGWLPKPLRMSKPKATPTAAAAPAKAKPTPAKPAAKGKAKPATKPAPKPKAKPAAKAKAKRAKAKP
jgi:ParB family chromosome partitioning protein